MNKLTAEKCRELLKELRHTKARGAGLTESAIGYLQALEIALPILEQQERGCQKCNGTGEMDSGGTQPWREQILVECDCQFEQQERGDGWIEWVGSECPVDGNTMVQIRWSDDSVVSGLASSYGWTGLNFGRIASYRIIPEQPTNQSKAGEL